MTQNRKLIAVTGGIGSGKSTAVNYIKEKGYPVLSCDEVCRNLYKTGKVKRKIKRLFPTAVKGKLKLTVDKSEIARLSFSDEKKYELLTDYLTELTFEKTMKLAIKRTGVVFIEVPLLFEFNKESAFDKVLVVLRNKEKRIESVKSRSGLSDEEVNGRILRQFDYDSKDLSNYSVIRNDDTVDSLYARLDEFLKTL